MVEKEDKKLYDMNGNDFDGEVTPLKIMFAYPIGFAILFL